MPHAPSNYICPICLGVQGVENEHTLLRAADRVYHDKHVSIFINSFWIGQNKAHLIVVPNQHYETVLDIPAEIGSAIFSASQIAVHALKAVYGCAGTTLRQNNQPAGDQHAFHYHLHVFPRYENDTFNQDIANHDQKHLSSLAERAPYAAKLKQYFLRHS